MAETRRYVPNRPLDLEQILQEAQHRWLRPAEICEILRNHHKFYLTPDPPVRPPAGSLFLFDRKVLRYFRKDGHRWRKKKDGKTVKEAHEKLKAGSVDVLHCYYAHGEDNDNFQRRSYWMLDEQLEHIVLVHYREVKEGYKLGVSRLPTFADPGAQLESPQTSSPCFEQSHSPSFTLQASYASTPNTVDRNGLTLSSEFDEGDSGGDPGASSLARSTCGSGPSDTSFYRGLLELSQDNLGSGFSGAQVNPDSSLLDDVHGLGKFTNPMDPKLYLVQSNTAELLSHKLIDAKLDVDRETQVASNRSKLVTDTGGVSQGQDVHLSQAQFHCQSGSEVAGVTKAAVGNISQIGRLIGEESGELKKLDSFGRWMDKEIGGDCDESLMASDSGNYWNTLETENDNKEVSSLSRHMQLDVDSLGPSLSQEQLFSISDFAPDWAYSGVVTKVLIIGTFLGDKKHTSGKKWCCMFGEIEVSAEVLTDNVIRCQVPLLAPGRFPFYITCSNRLACSEVREFEFREKPSGLTFSLAVRIAPEEEVRLQMRLAKILYIDLDRKWFDCSAVNCDKCKLKDEIYFLRVENGNHWRHSEDANSLIGGDCLNFREVLIQSLLKDKLYEWLVCNVHDGGKGSHMLDDEGQGVIHLAAALGYEWAVAPIVASGVSPNFRDARGRTALHWASFYGREGMVTELVRLGAAAGAVSDPTPTFPGGQTAADLASSRGHKGIAGYLAEADLISHLQSLTTREDVLDSVSATVAAEKALETATQGVIPLNRTADEELSMKGSLAAVRKSAHAAALIQAAFRARSFRHRQIRKSRDDMSHSSQDLIALGSLNKVQNMSTFEDYLHSAAVRIQQKYRGWKGRKDFLKIRNRIVKIQAHVRGHQVRKQYKKVIWSVSIVEKAILRWRRKKRGLRGFRTEKLHDSAQSELEKSDEYEFLRIGRKQKFAGVEKALARVQSMVRHPEARDQYMRLVARLENIKLNSEGSNR